jgi:hypothetical protein
MVPVLCLDREELSRPLLKSEFESMFLVHKKVKLLGKALRCSRMQKSTLRPLSLQRLRSIVGRSGTVFLC